MTVKIIASWRPPDIFRIALQIMLTIAVIQYLLQAANDLSVNWNLSFHISGPHLLTSQGILCGIALMRIGRDETAKAYFDEIIDEFASIKTRKVLFCFN